MRSLSRRGQVSLLAALLAFLVRLLLHDTHEDATVEAG
jgi:hypothetical protein